MYAPVDASFFKINFKAFRKYVNRTAIYPYKMDISVLLAQHSCYSQNQIGSRAPTRHSAYTYNKGTIRDVKFMRQHPAFFLLAFFFRFINKLRYYVYGMLFQ